LTQQDEATGKSQTTATLVIACGAIAHELVSLKKSNQWTHMDIQCLPAEWHNTPDKITPAIREKIASERKNYSRILVAYGDCGTGGLLDALLREEGIERLPGPHCYSFFAGSEKFDEIANDDIGAFYLTDYLAANFNRLILKELGIDKHPELMSMYFGNYNKVVYLSQRDDESLLIKAQAAADALSLPLEVHETGLDPLESSLRQINIQPIQAS